MPNHFPEWDAIWVPYLAFGSLTTTDKPVKEFVAAVKATGFTENLRACVPFYEILDVYREACRKLHGNSNYADRGNSEHIAGLEQTARAPVVARSRGFEEEARKVHESLAVMDGHVRTAAPLMKQTDRSSQIGFIKIGKLAGVIKRDIESDMANFSPRKIEITLDNIRRSPM